MKSSKLQTPNSTLGRRRQAAFTMVEIAISLAVIGFALVAIIGILPMGMQVQKDNREETIINQDATVWLDAIRNGGKALDDLTNYVYAISNYYGVYFQTPAQQPILRTVGYTLTNSTTTTPDFPVTWPITNGNHIVGLLSMPKYVDRQSGTPSYRSNHVVAFVRAMSGVASEKFPQTNVDVQAGSFSYRLIVDLVPYSDFDRNWTNYLDPTLYAPVTNAAEIDRRRNYFVLATNYQNNLYDLRLTFRWPLDIRGTPGGGRQVFRTLVGGRLMSTNDNGMLTYFVQPRTYGRAQ